MSKHRSFPSIQSVHEIKEKLKNVNSIYSILVDENTGGSERLHSHNKLEIALSTFPDLVLLRIFSHLSCVSLCRIAQTCKNCNRIAKEESLWKALYQLKWQLPEDEPDDNNSWKQKYKIATTSKFKAQPLIHSRLVKFQTGVSTTFLLRNEKKRSGRWFSRIFHRTETSQGYTEITGNSTSSHGSYHVRSPSRQTSNDQLSPKSKKLNTLPTNINILVLGNQFSGKHRLLKKLKVEYGDEYSLEERRDFKRIIQKTILRTIHVIIKACNSFGYKVLKENEEYVNIMNDAFAFTTEVVNGIKKLWDDTAIIKTLLKKSELAIPEHVEYFIEKIDDFSKQDYIPTDEDIIKCPDTSLTCEYGIAFEKWMFKFIAMGQTQKNASYWTSAFDFNAILFVVSLADYDYVSLERAPTNNIKKNASFWKTNNNLWDSLQIFAELQNEQNGRSIILIFTDSDIFKQKLFEVDLKVCFPDYTGGVDYSKACEFVKHKFLSICTGRKVFSEFSSDIDQNEMNFIFDCVKKKYQ